MGERSELRLTLAVDGTPSSPASDLARTDGVRDAMEALDLVNACFGDTVSKDSRGLRR